MNIHGQMKPSLRYRVFKVLRRLEDWLLRKQLFHPYNTLFGKELMLQLYDELQVNQYGTQSNDVEIHEHFGDEEVKGFTLLVFKNKPIIGTIGFYDDTNLCEKD
jgi:hypothetical protein